VTISKLLIGLFLITRLSALDLQPDTLRAWDLYIQNVDARVQDRLNARRSFLWIDESADRRMRVKRGDIVVGPVVGRGTQNVPAGLIHDWVGAVFIPGATVDGLLAVVQDYDRYKEFYRPVVADSKALAQTAGHQEFSMIWHRQIMMVNAAMQGRYRARNLVVDERRGCSSAESVEMREIENYGRAGERALVPDTGSGFIWRMYSVITYQSRDGGVYLELEAIALTRGIPASFHWLVSPIVNHLSINSLTTTLGQTRDAVKVQLEKPMLTHISQSSGGR
jgi:hypothetical protein